VTRLKIASWNINSVRARVAIVERLLKEEAPDILCLQETKAHNDVFPRQFFADLGYVHQALNGQKMHHGVATICAMTGRIMARPVISASALAISGWKMSISRPEAMYRIARSIPSSARSWISSGA